LSILHLESNNLPHLAPWFNVTIITNENNIVIIIIATRKTAHYLRNKIHTRLEVNDMSHSHSSSMPSVFDDRGFDIDQGEEEDIDEHYTDPTTPGDPTSYDLKAPLPSQPLSNIELLADRLFSVDHLKLIIKDHTLHTRFASFLRKYRPHASQALQRYLEAQKAVAAVEYANAIAEKLVPGAIAALLEDGFEESSRMAVDELINDALPGFITHSLVQIVTDTLVKEITGQNTPIMRELVAGLAEVYCLSDPSLPDDPIVYASEGMAGLRRIYSDVANHNTRVFQNVAIWQGLFDRSELSLLTRTTNIRC